MILRLLKRVNEQVLFKEILFSKRFDVFDGAELIGQFFCGKKQCFFTTQELLPLRP